MRVTHAAKYATVIELARKHRATEVSFQYHTFVNFAGLPDAEAFCDEAKAKGFDVWPINTHRPFIPFEVTVGRWGYSS